MFCTNCGHPLKEDAKFCVNCGSKIIAEEPAPVVAAPVAEAAAQPVPAPVEAVGTDPVAVEEVAEPVAEAVEEVVEVAAEAAAAPVEAFEPVAEPAPPVEEVSAAAERYYAPEPTPEPAPVFVAEPVPAAPAAPQQVREVVREVVRETIVSNFVPAYQMKTNRGLGKYFFLGIITLGIYPMVVMSHLTSDINIIASRYDGRKTMHFCAILLFATITLGIAPLVWGHRLCKRMGNELSRRGIDYKFGTGTYWGWGFFGSLILVGPFIYMHKMLKAMNKLCADYNKKG